MKSTKKRSSFSMQETDEAEEENEDLSDRQKQIREGGAVVTKNRKHTIQCLTVIGQIEGHYVGVPLAVAAKHSFIAPSASMTIHPVRMSGLMLGVPQTLEYFQRMQDRITNFVTANSGISYERFMQLAMNTQELVMDVGTVLDGDEAVAEGLIDTLGSLHDAMDCLDKMIAAEKNKQRAKPRKGKKSL